MQLLDHVLLLVGVVDVEVEHLAERLRVLEHQRQQEVQQRPQLVKVVLIPYERTGETTGRGDNGRKNEPSNKLHRQTSSLRARACRAHLTVSCPKQPFQTGRTWIYIVVCLFALMQKWPVECKHLFVSSSEVISCTPSQHQNIDGYTRYFFRMSSHNIAPRVTNRSISAGLYLSNTCNGVPVRSSRNCVVSSRTVMLNRDDSFFSLFKVFKVGGRQAQRPGIT